MYVYACPSVCFSVKPLELLTIPIGVGIDEEKVQEKKKSKWKKKKERKKQQQQKWNTTHIFM